MLILLLSSCAFAPLPNDAAKELARMEGKWIVWGSEQAGSYSEGGNFSTNFVTIKDDLLVHKTGNDVFYSARMKIIRTGVVDFFPNEKPFKGQRWEGIYKIDGDKLTICRLMGESDEVKRPTQFKTAKDPNDPYILYVLKRIKD